MGPVRLKLLPDAGWGGAQGLTSEHARPEPTNTPQLHGTFLASPCCTLHALGGHLPGGVTAAYTLCWVLSAQSPEASALSSWKSLVLPERQQASLGSGTLACASCCPLSSSPTPASLQSLLSKPLPSNSRKRGCPGMGRWLIPGGLRMEPV